MSIETVSEPKPGAPAGAQPSVPRHRHRLLSGMFGALLVLAAVLALVAALVARGGKVAAEDDAGLLTLTPKANLQVIQAQEGQQWTHAPQVPPRIDRNGQARVVVKWTASEWTGNLDPANGVRYSYWGFEGSVPGPMLRVRVGDLIEMHLTNDAKALHPHNIDFHFVTGPGGGAKALTVNPGQTAVVEARAMAPGIYMYHCATPDIPTHIANGMYGYVIVEPRGGMPEVDKELYVVQSEFYTQKNATGPATLSVAKLDAEAPDYVVFNGATGSLMGNAAPKAKVGDKIRIWIGNAGPELVSSFHVIGEIFDTVYREGDLVSAPARGIQTTLVPAGGASAVEFTVDVPGTYLLVDHAIARALHKGAVGSIVVEGDPNGEIFAPGAGNPTPAPGADGHDMGPAAATVKVMIAKGAWDPKNAEKAYSPKVLNIKAGTTVTFVNGDEMAHTVTANGKSFDSGFLNPGQSWTYTFSKPGTYPYYCIPHPWMKATVVVSS